MFFEGIMAGAALLGIRYFISEPRSLHLLGRQKHWHPVVEPAGTQNILTCINRMLPRNVMASCTATRGL